jgi:hypothetical protein
VGSTDEKERPMMKRGTSIIAALAMGVLLVGISGCQEGPLERAGKKVDKSVEKSGQQIEKVGKDIKKDVAGK